MNQPRLARVDQSKLREAVYDALRLAFTRGEFAPGDVVSLRDLANQLGTSMTPVREAVRRLVAEGALTDTPSRTLMVPTFNARRMQDLKGARLALETLALEQAIGNVTRVGIAELEEILACKRADESTPDLETNYAFHFTVYRMSGSEILLPLIEALWMQYGAYLNLIIKQQSAVQMEEHVFHHKIIEALRHGDLDTARAALAEDIERSFRVLLPEPEERTAT